MGSTVDGPGFGAYLHIPFCRHRCDYCAFATFTDRDHLMGDYASAVASEIGRAVGAGMPPVTSVFVGGGTPTRLDPRTLMSLIALLPVIDDVEITIECNPDDVTGEMMRIYADGGVNRLSFGVQSMRDHVLAALGRTHRPDNVRRSVEFARDAGIDDINLDLIYGVHGETVDDWRHTVTETLRLEPRHVSAYGLTVEGGTPLADDPSRHPDDDVQADMYEVADEMLTAAGLANYEVSNWARPGRECRHNRLYWQQGDYLGFGSAAHSHIAGRRWWNVRTPDRYIDLIGAGETAESSSETLDDDERRIEGLQLALRMRDGVPSESFSADDLEFLAGLIEPKGSNVVLTRRGRLMANEVSLRLR